MRPQGGLGGRGYSARKLDPTGAVDATGLGATGTSASERTVRVQLPLWNPCHASRGFRVRISVAIPGPNKIRDPPASGLPSAETERQGPATRRAASLDPARGRRVCVFSLAPALRRWPWRASRQAGASTRRARVQQAGQTGQAGGEGGQPL